MIIVFLVPSQFFIKELNGENITYATEKAARIREISLSESLVSVPDVVTAQSFASTKRGRNALRLETIIFPIKITIIIAIKVFLLISSVNASSNSDYFSS